jgi:Mg2+ and Co2+ transporter CorA
VIRAWLYRPHVDEHEDAPTDQLADLVDPKQALLWVDCVDPTESELDSLTKQLDISHLPRISITAANARSSSTIATTSTSPCTTAHSSRTS